MDSVENKILSSPEKPEFLYHASPHSDMDVLEPRAKRIRDLDEGPVIFATSSFSLATMFIVRSDGSWGDLKGRFNAFYMVIGDKKHFLKADKGGVIYTLPNDKFYCDLKKGMGKYEWVSKKSVKPIKKQSFKSGLEAMIDNSIQVYFVDKPIFQEIEKSQDHGYTILQSIQSENQKRDKNVLSI